MTTPPKVAQAVDDQTEWISAYREAKAHAKRWEEIAARAKGHLIAELGDAEIGTVAGHEAVRNTIVNSTHVDLDKLRAEHPDLVARYTVPRVKRRFTITGQVA